MQRVAQMASSLTGETQNRKEVLPVAKPGKKTTPFHQTTPCGNKNPDAVADINLKVPTGTEKRKWWKTFSSKRKKTKAVSGDTKKQRDGHKKKNWWKPFKFIKNQITSRNDGNVEENNDLTLREPEVIMDKVTASPKIVEPIKLSSTPTEIANNNESLKLENIDGNCFDRKIDTVDLTLDETLDQSTSKCEGEAKKFDREFQEPPDNPNFPYEIPLKINGLSVKMFVDSGCHYSLISKRSWKMMGKPKLAPVKFYETAAFGGSAIRYKGQFIGEVQFCHRKFRLPLLVTSDSNSHLKSFNPNILGRTWLCCINLDWNKYFNPEIVYLREETEDHRILTQELESSCNSQPHVINVSLNSVPIQTMMMNPGRVDFQEETESMRKLALELKRSCHSRLFTIKVNIEGVSIEMVVDSGTSVSIIGRDLWKLLGKPKLEPTKLVLTAANGRSATIKGKCFVDVEYFGQKCVLPLFVLPRMKCIDSLALIGGNWFHLLRIDFNSLFEAIRYCRKKTKKPKGFHKYVEDRCRLCKCVWANG